MDDEPHDLIGAYAVDALDAAERLAFEQHLGSCASCREELAGFGDALAELSADYQSAPPPALRAAVLDAVAALQPSDAVPGLPRRAEPSADAPRSVAEPPQLPRRALAEPGAGAPDQPVSASVTPLRPASAARGRWQLLVAAAVALIAVIGISVWQPWAPRALTAADVLAAPDAVRATKTVDGDASVTLVRSNGLGKAVLITRNMPPAPAGKVHQAWLLQPSGTMVSAGMMPAGADVTMLLEGDARDTMAAGISVEPPGGSAQPNTVGVIVIEL